MCQSAEVGGVTPSPLSFYSGGIYRNEVRIGICIPARSGYRAHKKNVSPQKFTTNGAKNLGPVSPSSREEMRAKWSRDALLSTLPLLRQRCLRIASIALSSCAIEGGHANRVQRFASLEPAPSSCLTLSSGADAFPARNTRQSPACEETRYRSFSCARTFVSHGASTSRPKARSN